MKRTCKYVFIAISALIFPEATVFADSVNTTLTGAGPVDDGVDYVLPYQLNINGGVPFDADCYDYFDQVVPGQSWLANEFNLNQAADSGAFGGTPNSLTRYEEVAWLSSQATTTPQDQIDLQHVIWNVFDPGSFGTTTGMQAYLDNWEANGLGLGSSYYSNYVFLEATAGTPGDGSFPQAFVFTTPGNTETTSGTPEPGSMILSAIGLSLMAIAGIRHAKPLAISPPARA
jgi:hypothetical protein